MILIVLILILLHVTFAEECTGSNWKACSLTKDSIKSYGAITISGKVTIEGVNDLTFTTLTIEESGNLSGVAGGYAAGQAHESCYKYNNNYAGGYHGGSSGYYPYTYSCGNYKEPVLMGGGAYHSRRGGAAVKITASTLIINGRIDMTGEGTSVSGGAGGSIWIITTTLSGTGIIKANGGVGADGYSGGGGGRIAIYADNDTEYTGNIFACGGTSTNSLAYHGTAGSIYKEINGVTALIVDNCHNNISTQSYIFSAADIANSKTFEFDSLSISKGSYVSFYPDISNESDQISITLGSISMQNFNHNALYINDYTSINILANPEQQIEIFNTMEARIPLESYFNTRDVQKSRAVYQSNDGLYLLNSQIVVASNKASLMVPSNIILIESIISSYNDISFNNLVAIGNSKFQLYNLNQISQKNDIHLYDRAIFTIIHQVLATDITMTITNLYLHHNSQFIIDSNRLILTSTLIHILDDSYINGIGLGYPNGQAAPGCYKYNNNYAGGYHGGSSGYYQYGYSCGNYKEPILMGSGAYHSMRGGAAVKIITDSLLVNGRIDMSGGGTSVSGGAGGSIWIITTTLSGTGVIKANGGDGTAGMSGGGGGRIAIYADNDTEYTGEIHARGGISTNSGGYSGSTGSIYLLINEISSLIFDNTGRISNTYSILHGAELNDVHNENIDILKIISRASFAIAKDKELSMNIKVLDIVEESFNTYHMFYILKDTTISIDSSIGLYDYFDLTTDDIELYQQLETIKNDADQNNVINMIRTSYKSAGLYLKDLRLTIEEDGMLDLPSSTMLDNCKFTLSGTINNLQQLILSNSFIEVLTTNILDNFQFLYMTHASILKYHFDQQIFINQIHLLFTSQIQILKGHFQLTSDLINIQDVSSKIDGVGGGYTANQAAPGCYKYNNNYAGGYHGGSSGYYHYAYSCGNYKEPILMGSGAHHSMAGGAAIKVTTTSLIVNGKIDMSGDGTSVSGGAGGSIWIITKTLSGNGIIKANGGDGTSGYSGGGGGRIAIYADNDTEYTGFVIARGGYSSHSYAYHGTAGSVYKEINQIRSLYYRNLPTAGLMNPRQYYSRILAKDVANEVIEIDNLYIQSHGALTLGSSVNNTLKIVNEIYSDRQDLILLKNNDHLDLSLTIDNNDNFNDNVDRKLYTNDIEKYRLHGYIYDPKFDKTQAKAKPILYITIQEEAGFKYAKKIYGLNMDIDTDATLTLPSHCLFIDSDFVIKGNITYHESSEQEEANQSTDSSSSSDNPFALDHLYLIGSSTWSFYHSSNKIFKYLQIGDLATLHFYSNTMGSHEILKVDQSIKLTEYAEIQIHQMNLQIETNLLSIDKRSSINGVGLGYPKAQAHESCYKINNNYAGGYHGGSSGQYQYAYSCGNYKEPILMGSGAFHSMAGGAAIKLIVPNLIINGKIDMSGGGTSVSGGAGGSIWIITKILSGTGVIKANGGDGASGYSGGGGGRIAIYSDSLHQYTGDITACGGYSSHHGKYSGTAGSIYFENHQLSSNETIYKLVFDNCNHVSNTLTLFQASQSFHSVELLQQAEISLEVVEQEDHQYDIGRLYGDLSGTLTINSEVTLSYGFYHPIYFTETLRNSNWTLSSTTSKRFNHFTR